MNETPAVKTNLGDNPVVRNLVNALVDADSVIERASITFRHSDGTLETCDLNNSVGERLGVIFGLYVYWKVLDSKGILVLVGGFPHEVAPVIFEGVTNTPLTVHIDNTGRIKEYIVSGDKFVMLGNIVIGRGENFGHCLQIIRGDALAGNQTSHELSLEPQHSVGYSSNSRQGWE